MVGLRGWAPLQVDSHLAELTVKETMDFSARVQGPGTKRGASPPSACFQALMVAPGYHGVNLRLEHHVYTIVDA